MVDYPYEYYGPRLVFHGGLCCGIKTIYGFTYRPTDELDGLDPCKSKDSSDKYGAHVKSKQRFFTDEAPPKQQQRGLTAT